MQLIRKGNAKLGPDVYKVSLAARKSCPGASGECLRECYALRIEKRWKGPREAWGYAFELAQNDLPLFESLLREQMPRSGVLRIHESGDFFSVGYIRMWARVIASFPEVQFYAYTRSWRVETLRNELQEAQELSNFHLWASTDSETGPAPAGWRDAHMMPKGRQRAKGYATCPEQTGIQPDCSTCTLCWVAKPEARLAFIKH